MYGVTVVSVIFQLGKFHQPFFGNKSKLFVLLELFSRNGDEMAILNSTPAAFPLES